MEERKKVRQFLIKRFILILFFIAVCNTFLGMLFNSVIYPFLSHALAWNVFRVHAVYPKSVLTNILSLMLWFLAQGTLSLLPATISRPLRDFLSMHWQSNMKLGIGEYFSQMPTGLLVLYYLGCIAILLLLLVFTLLPYFLGLLLYIRMVHEEVEKIVEEENRQHALFDKKRNLLFSDIAHDLKTPIQTISGYAQALKDGMVESEKQKSYLDAICGKSKQMNDLIMILFEYVKLDSYGFSLNKKKTDMAELLRENVALVYDDFEKAGMNVSFDIPEEPVWFMADEPQINRAVMNLLTNALKYCKEGDSVTIRMERMLYSNKWSILVGDTGKAIDPESAEHIFEPFYREDKARTSKSGSGLGLSISQKIIAMHGWKLLLYTKPSKEYTKAFVISMSEEMA